MKTVPFVLSLVGSITMLIFGIAYPDDVSAIYSGTHSILGTTSPVVELGDVPLLGTSHKKIRLFNFHTQPIRIPDVGSSCGCTVIEGGTQVIPPWRFGSILVSISPRRSGKGTQTVNLQTNMGYQLILLSYNATLEDKQVK